MIDQTLNRFVASGPTAARTAFVPNPGTPASGPSPGYTWFDTTLNQLFAWSGSAWVSTAGSGGITQLTGDGTAGPGSGSQALTLAASGVTAGSYGDATHVAQVTLDGKGRVTAASSVAISGGSSSGGLVLLEHHTAAASATLDFTAWYAATYDEYLIEVVNVLPDTLHAALQLLVSSNAGTTWDTGANYRYDFWGWRAGGSASDGASTQTQFVLTWVSGGFGLTTTAANGGQVGQVRLFSPGSTTAGKFISGQMFFISSQSGTPTFGMQVGGLYTQTAAINGLRFKMSSGNLASGNIRIYGIVKT
jgi:hypothetical protein